LPFLTQLKKKKNCRVIENIRRLFSIL